MFQLRGKRQNGQLAELTWEAGRITADTEVLDEYDRAAREYSGMFMLVATGKSDKDPLAFVGICYTFLYDIEVSGDYPTLPPVPEGAVS